MKIKLTLADFLNKSIDAGDELPRLPSLAELMQIRKGIRKKSLPNVTLLPDKFSYENLGEFVKQSGDRGVVFEWRLSDQSEMKNCSFVDLCMETSKECDRLELGWMIANFARLDMVSTLSKLRPISYRDSHQKQLNLQYQKQVKHYQNNEIAWRHWAIAPVGRMIIE